jgi:hypothetical protein
MAAEAMAAVAVTLVSNSGLDGNDGSVAIIMQSKLESL